MDTNHYEVVVCGPDLPGLIAAAVIARRGHRVLLCGHDREPSSFQAGGFTLDREPGVLPAPEPEPVARILRELNYVPIVRRRAPALFPAVQVLMPHHKLEFVQSPEALRRELARAFPADHEAVSKALDRLAAASAVLDPLLASDLTLPPEGFWERREVARVQALLPPANSDLLAPLPADHPIRAALGALAAFGAAFGPADLGMLPRARAFDVTRRGFHRMEGGLGALRALFLDKIATYSGEVRERSGPVEVLYRRGRLSGLRLGLRDESVGLDHLVWAGSVGSLAALLGDRPSRKVREAASSLRPACFRYTLALLVRPEAIPASFGPRVIAVADPTRPPLEDNALQITVGAAPRGEHHLPLWVECLVPAPAVAGGPGYLALVRARVRERLTNLLPFLDLNLVVLASPHDGLAPEVPGHDELEGSLAPVPATPMAPALSCDLPRMLEIGAVPYSTGLRNVLLASHEILPGLGPEGAFVTAHGVLRLLRKSLPDRHLRRREIVIDG